MGQQTEKNFSQFLTSPSEEAFAPVFEETRNLVYTICRRMTGNDDDAEDALQLTYARLIEAARLGKEIPNRHNASAALSRLAVLEADALRKRRNRRSKREIIMENLPTASSGKNSPVQAAQDEETRRKIDEVVAALPEKDRLAVQLHYLHGMTHQEVAYALGLPRETVTSRLRRSLKKMEPGLRRAGLGDSAAVLAALAAVSGLMMAPASMTAGAVWSNAAKIALPAVGGAGVLAVLKTKVALVAAAAVVVGGLAVLAVVQSSGIGADELNGTAGTSTTTTELTESAAPQEPPQQQTAVVEVLNPEPTENQSVAVAVANDESLATPTPDASPTPQSTPVIPEPRLEISGRVTDGDGQPVADAHVSVSTMMIDQLRSMGRQSDSIQPVYRAEAAVVYTDERGFYTAAVPDFLVYMVMAERAGQARSGQMVIDRAGIAGGARTRGSRSEKVDLVLMGEAALSGVVVGPDDEPIAGAHLYAHSPADGYLARAETAIAEDGTFAFSGLKVGDYSVVVDAQGFGASYRRLKAPATDVTIHLDREGTTLRGNVFNLRGGMAVQDLPLKLVHPFTDDMAFDPPALETATDGVGGFEFPYLKQGKYVLMSGDRKYRILNDAGEWGYFFEVKAGEDLDPVKLNVYIGHTIRGVLTEKETGQPFEGAEVQTLLHPYVSGQVDVTDSEGRFILTGIFGNITTESVSGENVTRRSIQPDLFASAPGYRNATATERVNLTADNLEVVVNFELEQTPHIRGRLLDEYGNPILHATVSIQDRSSTGPSRTGVSFDGDGTFSVPAPSNSKVQLAVQADGFPGFFTEEFDVQESPVELGDVVIPFGAVIEGTIKDRDGHPVSGAIASIGVAYRGEGMATTNAGFIVQSDGKGFFRFDDVPTAEHGMPAFAESAAIEIYFRHPGYIEMQRDLHQIDPEKPNQIEVIMRREGDVSFLSGVLVDAQGEPITSPLRMRADGPDGYFRTFHTMNDGTFEFGNVSEDEVTLTITGHLPVQVEIGEGQGKHTMTQYKPVNMTIPSVKTGQDDFVITVSPDITEQNTDTPVEP